MIRSSERPHRRLQIWLEASEAATGERATTRHTFSKNQTDFSGKAFPFLPEPPQECRSHILPVQGLAAPLEEAAGGKLTLVTPVPADAVRKVPPRGWGAQPWRQGPFPSLEREAAPNSTWTVGGASWLQNKRSPIQLYHLKRADKGPSFPEQCSPCW